MPSWYRLRNNGEWSPIRNVYRLRQESINGVETGVWKKIKTIYRLRGNGEWGVVHESELDTPVATTQPTLLSQNNSSTIFFGGDTLTLTRGAYTNTTNDSNTTYRMRIYKGQDNSLPLNITNWTLVSEGNFTGANSNANTSITGAVTNIDARDGFYFVGEVRVNNDANTAGSPTYDFETSRVLSRINFDVSNFVIDLVTDKGARFTWSLNVGITFIYSQTLTIRLNNSSGNIVKTESISPGITSVTISDATNILSNQQYHATITVIANDGWKLTQNFTASAETGSFTTTSLVPVNTIPPVIGFLTGGNYLKTNRTPPSGFAGYLPVSTLLTASTGTWNNVGVGTSYSYNWTRVDNNETPIPTGFISQNNQTYTAADVEDLVFVNVRATNSDGGIGTASSGTYILGQQITVGLASPTTVTPGSSNNFAFTISNYPVSYTVNWGDGSAIESYNVSSDTQNVNASIAHTYSSSGNYDLVVTAQPGNVSRTTSISSQIVVGAFTYSIADTTIVPATPDAYTNTFNSSGTQISYDWNNTANTSYWETTISGGPEGSRFNETFSSDYAYSVTPGQSYTTTVVSVNNNKKATVSWSAASNANSYIVSFTNNGVSGTSGVITNTSYDIPTSGTVTVNSVTAYSNNNGTGSTRSGTLSGSSTVTPVAKVSPSRSSGPSTAPNVPVNITAPVVSPTSGAVGTTFTSTNGTWTSDTSLTFTYQWQNDDSGSFANIAGATGSSHTSFTVANIRCIVTATNIVGSNSAASNTAQVTPAPPFFPFFEPSFTLTVNCNGGAGCPASGTHNGSYTIPSTNPLRDGFTFNGYDATCSGSAIGRYTAGQTISCAGTIVITASWTADAVAPFNISAPFVSPSGGAVGTVFTTTNGSWSGNPAPTFTYQWQNDSSGSFANIAGATGSSHTSSTVANLRCIVTATNSAGSNSAASNTVQVTLAPPFFPPAFGPSFPFFPPAFGPSFPFFPPAFGPPFFPPFFFTPGFGF